MSRRSSSKNPDHTPRALEPIRQDQQHRSGRSLSVNYNQYHITINTPVQKPHPGIYIQNKNLKKETRQLRQENQEKDRQIEDYQHEVNRCEKENEDLKRRVLQTNHSKIANESKCFREISQNKEQLVALAKEKLSLQSENQKVKSKFTVVEQANDMLKEELNMKNQELEREKKEIEYSTMTVANLTQLIQNYKTQAMEYKEKMEREMMSKDQDLRDRNREIIILRKERDDLKTLLLKDQSRTEEQWEQEVIRVQRKLNEEMKHGRQMTEEMARLKEEVERLVQEKKVIGMKKVEEGRSTVLKLYDELMIENESLKSQNTIYLYLLIIIGSIILAWLLLKLA